MLVLLPRLAIRFFVLFPRTGLSLLISRIFTGRAALFLRLDMRLGLEPPQFYRTGFRVFFGHRSASAAPRRRIPGPGK